MARLDVCERTQQEIQRDGGGFCKFCGWELGHHRPPPDCVIGKPCVRHGFIHGAEAEELREALERHAETDEAGANWARRILDEVDARDALAYREVVDAEAAQTTEGA